MFQQALNIIARMKIDDSLHGDSNPLAAAQGNQHAAEFLEKAGQIFMVARPAGKSPA